MIDGPTGAEIQAPGQGEHRGRHVLGGAASSSSRAISDPRAEDYSGTKIRTMPAQVIQEQFKAFGATPVTVDFKELYSAMQQRVVEARRTRSRPSR